MKRLCKFCHYPASYEPLEEMERVRLKVFYCHPCQAEYLYFADKAQIVAETPSSISLYALVNKKMYRWTIGANKCGRLWLIKQPGIPGKTLNDGMESIFWIKDAEESLEVTPLNIVSKIEAWLPFL